METETLGLNVAVHFWDMDHTLINNDCDVSWKQFLMQCGLAPASDLPLIDLYYDQYLQGRLDIDAFNAFQLREFVGKSYEEMQPISSRHFETMVRPKIYAQAQNMVHTLHEAGVPQVLLTATNRIIAEPLAAYLGLTSVLATELERVDGRFTGRFAGTYCMAEGKLQNLKAYCADNRIAIEDVAYYGDSKSDIPVLLAVGHPVAANPVPILRETATARGWRIIDFR